MATARVRVCDLDGSTDDVQKVLIKKAKGMELCAPCRQKPVQHYVDMELKRGRSSTTRVISAEELATRQPAKAAAPRQRTSSGPATA